MPGLRKQIKHRLHTRLLQGRDITVKAPGVRGVADGEALEAETINAVTRGPDIMMDSGELIKDGGACKVVRIQVGGAPYIVKRYNWRGWKKGLRYMLKGSRARRVWFYSSLLSEIGVRNPLTLCWLEKISRGVVRQSYIVTEYVEGVRLYDYLRAECRTEEERSAILEKMNDLLRKLHSHRITHGDMKRSNVLVADGDICLIDLDAASIHWCRLIYRIKRRRDLKLLSKRLLGPDMPGQVHEWCRSLMPDS